MQDSSVPPKIPTPWANSAGSANIRTIPLASQLAIQAGAASFTDGFVPLNFVPVSAGGVPPFGQDFNGILQLMTQWLRWGCAGGAVRYDAAFVSAIGGYPIGSRLMSNSGHAIYECLVDNNSGDPNAGAANWRVQSSVWSMSPWQAAGSANIQTVALNPAPASTAQLSGIPFSVLSQGTNTGAVTLNVNGLGALPIVTTGGVALAPGVLVTSYPFTVRLLGSAFVMLSWSPLPTIPRSGSFGLSGSLGGLGATNWTVPAGVYTVGMHVWGAGGGGGGSSSGQAGGGGGAGAYSEGIFSVTPGQVLAVFVGSGGAGGPAGNLGATGGTSFVTGFLQAGGGAGGQGTTPWGGGSGGAATLGNILNLTGGHGGGGIIGSAGAGGAGGGAPMGGAGDAASAGVPGNAAVVPGGGGAGFGGGGPGTGSSGASGLVLFDW